MLSVFAGQDNEATARARSYFLGWPPSSPSIALLRDGKLVFFMPRSDIEIHDAADIADDLQDAFAKFCSPVAG
jgi:bacilliredoxin